MQYENVREGIFLARPNRFIAHAEIGGEECICHVKNTGRCRELLVPGAKVLVSRASNPLRKTAYDLFAVYKKGLLINMDSQAVNRVVGEYLPTLFPQATLIRPEYTFGKSRIDFYVEEGDRKILIEAKGVTLEQDGIALFPDAPTERGVKHLRELTGARAEGWECWVIFLIQMKGIRCFRPNDVTHPAFGEALREARAAGVRILAIDSLVTEDTLLPGQEIPIEL